MFLSVTEKKTGHKLLTRFDSVEFHPDHSVLDTPLGKLECVETEKEIMKQIQINRKEWTIFDYAGALFVLTYAFFILKYYLLSQPQ
jgi:hypothetical protein